MTHARFASAAASAAFERRRPAAPEEGPATLFAAGALHEIYAAAPADAVAAAGFALAALAAAPACAGRRATLWARHDLATLEQGRAYAPGLPALGLDPADLVAVGLREPREALQAGLEGARSAALAAVIVELAGESPAYDLVASRRLAFAAAASGTRVIVLRSAATPAPSAAETRWRVRAAPSTPLPAEAPGRPAFELTLLRRRSGPEGLRWIVEWNRDDRRFVERPALVAARDDAGPALSGAVVPLSALRADGGADAAGWRRAG